MAAGDQYAFYLREKVVSGGTQGVILLGIKTGLQCCPFITGAWQLMHGWDFTAAKLSGTDRSIQWSVREVSGSSVTELYTFSAQTISTAEYSLTANSTSIQSRTTDYILSVWVDLANMTTGDTYTFYLREKVDAGTQRLIPLVELSGAQGGPLVIPAFLLLDGWDWTAKKIAGTDRTFSWSIRAAQ
jgi:hypothetical protein